MESVSPICRICLNTSTKWIEMQTPFRCKEQNSIEEESELSYLECLRLCTLLPIKANDGGPQSICGSCDTELQIVYTFLQKAKKSQMILEENCLEISIANDDDDDEIILEHEIKSEESTEDVGFDFISVKSLNPMEYEEETEQNTRTDSTKLPEGREKFKSEDLDISQDSSQSEATEHKCNICNRTYQNAYSLKKHQRYHELNGKNQKSDKCKICGKQFSTKQYLKRHMVVHQDTRKTFKCQYCEKEYTAKTTLTSHLRLHRGDTLNCSECGKQFTRQYELNIHMRFHKREYPYQCEICGKKYGVKSHLDTHIMQHKGIRVQCDVCEKSFTCTSSLRKHYFSHTEMPYLCEFCHKGFPMRQIYKLHLERTHGLNELKNIDLTQLPSLNKVKKFERRKNFKYIQVAEEANATEQ